MFKFFKLQNHWPNSVFMEFISYLSSNKYPFSTIRSYLDKLKIYGHILRSYGYTENSCESVLNDQRVFKKTLLQYHRLLCINDKKKRVVSSLNLFIASWHSFQKWFCFSRNLHAPSERIRYFKRPDSMPNLISLTPFSSYVPEDDKDLEHLKKWCILDLICHAGLRNCELSKLQIRNFVPSEKAIYLDKRFKRPRIIYLDQKSTMYLNKYIELLVLNFDLKSKLNPKFPLFTKKNGTAVTESGITKIISRLTSKLTGHAVTPRTLRNSCLYNYLIESGDVRAVQILMGYKNVSSILKFRLYDINLLRNELKKAPHRFHWNPKDTF